MEWLGQRLSCVPRIVRGLALRGGWVSPQEIQDVASDAVEIALDRLHTYHGLVPLEAWLHRICVLTLRGCARRLRRLPVTGAPVDPRVEHTALDELEQREGVTRVLAAMDAVGGAEGELLRQRHLDRIDFVEIARRTGISVATLRTRYARGLKRLRDKLARRHDEGRP